MLKEVSLSEFIEQINENKPKKIFTTSDTFIFFKYKRYMTLKYRTNHVYYNEFKNDIFETEIFLIKINFLLRIDKITKLKLKCHKL